MVAGYVILRYLAFIDFFLLGEEVYSERFLQKGIALVFLVC